VVSGQFKTICLDGSFFQVIHNDYEILATGH